PLAREPGLASAVGESVVPHPVDPALEDGGDLHPVHREDRDDEVGGEHAAHVVLDFGGVGLLAVAPFREVRGGHAGVEVLGVQVGQVDPVAGGGEAAGGQPGDVGGERVGAGVGEDEQGGGALGRSGLHGSPPSVRLSGRSVLRGDPIPPPIPWTIYG